MTTDRVRQRHVHGVQYIVSIWQVGCGVAVRQTPGTMQYHPATRPPSKGNILDSGGPQQVQDQGMWKLCPFVARRYTDALLVRQSPLKPPRVSFACSCFICATRGKDRYKMKEYTEVGEAKRGLGISGRMEKGLGSSGRTGQRFVRCSV